MNLQWLAMGLEIASKGFKPLVEVCQQEIETPLLRIFIMENILQLMERSK